MYLLVAAGLAGASMALADMIRRAVTPGRERRRVWEDWRRTAERARRAERQSIPVSAPAIAGWSTSHRSHGAVAEITVLRRQRAEREADRTSDTSPRVAPCPLTPM